MPTTYKKENNSQICKFTFLPNSVPYTFSFPPFLMVLKQTSALFLILCKKKTKTVSRDLSQFCLNCLCFPVDKRCSSQKSLIAEKAETWLLLPSVSFLCRGFFLDEREKTQSPGKKKSAQLKSGG